MAPQWPPSRHVVNYFARAVNHVDGTPYGNIPKMALPIWNLTQISNNLSRTNLQWTTPNITFGFPTSTPVWAKLAEGRGFTSFNESQKQSARLAVGLFDDVIRPDFIETSARPQVTFQNTVTNIGYAHAYYPGLSAPSGSAWFNPNYKSGTSSVAPATIGQSGFMTYVHELGHSMGLDHPGTYNGGSPTYELNAKYQQDSRQYTVMSYFAAAKTGADHVASNGQLYVPQTLMLHDIKALQDMYGAETTTRTGNTVYGFHANAGRSVYDFNINKHPVISIWDSAGVDTLDFSGFATPSRINLTAGNFSDADGMTKNISIAFGATIENAIGGNGIDVITGNEAANNLKGGNAADTIVGAGGNDVLQGDAGNDTLQGGVGADQFVFINTAIGRDRIVDFDDNIDKLRVSKILADAVTDFVISGNGTTNVTLAIAGQTISVQDNAAVSLSSTDFFFV